MAIVNGNFGHEGSGKLYSYYDPHGTRRAGDTVVVEVTQSRTFTRNGKTYTRNNPATYKTLLTIRSTHGSGTAGDALTRDNLDDRGIELKPVLGGSQKQLPGYYEGWAKDAKAEYELQVEALMGGASKSELSSIKKWTSSVRSETKQQYDDAMKRLSGTA